MRIGRLAAGFVLAIGAVAGGPRAAEAGPPCVCWPIDIGEARSLPWGDGPMTTRQDYDLRHLVPDTLGILDATSSPLVRMETCRRAALYLMRDEGRDSRRAWELYGRLAGRALAEVARRRRDPLPWFDVTYLLAAFRQASVGGEWPDTAEFGNVYSSRTSGDPAWAAAAAEMAVGDALMRYMGEGDAWRPHVLFAVDHAAEGTLLAKNVLRLFGRDGYTLASLRARVAAPAEGTPHR